MGYIETLFNYNFLPHVNSLIVIWDILKLIPSA